MFASGEPFEFLGYQNTTGVQQTVHIVIGRFRGPSARLKFVFVGSSGITGVQYNSSAGGDIVGPSIFGHNGAASVATTAAIPYDNSDTSEDYSSRGPVTLYLQPSPSHAPLAMPQVLNQPASARPTACRRISSARASGAHSGSTEPPPPRPKRPRSVRCSSRRIPVSPPRNSSRQCRPLLDRSAPTGRRMRSAADISTPRPRSPASSALPGPPSVPTTVNGDTKITVRWTAATTDPNFPLTGYVVTPYVDGVAQAPVTVDANTTSTLFTDLVDGTNYSFTVAATNANGTGPASGPSTTVAIGLPGAPSGVVAVVDVHQAQVSWSPPPPDDLTITGYTVATAIGGVTQATQTFPTTATTQSIAGLLDNTTYTFSVAAVDAFGTGAFSAPSSPLTMGVPDPPTAVVAQPSYGGLVVLTWTAPADHGSPILTNVITPYLNGTIPLPPVAGSGTLGVVTGLTPGQSYTFTVAATNARGTGDPSAPSTPIIEGTPVAPVAPVATPGNGTANVTWIGPMNDSGSVVTGFTLRAYVGATAVATHTYPSTALSAVFGGLTNGTTYRFTIAATNSVGLGPQSVPSVPVTVGAPSAPLVSGVPAVGRATISWTAAPTNGSAVTGYTVTPYLAGVAQSPQSFSSATRSAVISALSNATTYGFTVAATNAAGTGPESGVAMVTVGAPTAPTQPSALPGNEAADVHWTAPATNNGAAIEGYMVTPYVNGIAQPTQTFASTATTAPVAGLGNGHAYTFRVQAFNARGIRRAVDRDRADCHRVARGADGRHCYPRAPLGDRALDGARKPRSRDPQLQDHRLHRYRRKDFAGVQPRRNDRDDDRPPEGTALQLPRHRDERPGLRAAVGGVRPRDGDLAVVPCRATLPGFDAPRGAGDPAESCRRPVPVRCLAEASQRGHYACAVGRASPPHAW